MISTKLLFNRATGLGFAVAQPGDIVDVLDVSLAQELCIKGRAVPAPGEPELVIPSVLTADAVNPEAAPPKKGRKL